jgi:hypothetical protein
MARPSDFTQELADIYGLYDADDNLRYIGKANNAEARLKSHMRDSTRRDTPLYRWIRKNGKPVMKVFVSGCVNWKEEERRLIAQARANGERLLNVADGGDEPFCSKEVRASNGRKNAKAIHSDPVRKRIWLLKRELGHAIKGGWVTNATRNKMRLAARNCPALFGEWSGIPDRIEVA